MASTYFDDQWLGMEAYKEWLLRGDDCTSAKCKLVPIPRNKIELSNMGKRAIRSHAKGKKHCSSTLDKFVVPEAAIDAEIRWCLKNVVSSYSFRPCDGLADLFRSMFPDSTIDEKFFFTERQMCIFY